LDYAIAIAFAIFVWWFSTGAVLYLLRMPSQTFGTSMLTTTALASTGLLGLWVTSDDTTVASAFCGFSCALVVWAWHEMSFLTGFVTGSRVSACPIGGGEGLRFVNATQTVIYHEVAILVTALGIVALTWGQPNQFGTMTFIVLWLARISAKLNVFLGVPNLTEEFLPAHLAYLKSYFRNRPMNLLFPLSVTASTVLTWLCIDHAIAANASAFSAAGWSLLGTLMFLVVIEHWFLVLPLPVASLWNWKSTDATEDNGVMPGEMGAVASLACDDHLRALARRA
jgi:putative photosynthetic complex assembly protein 2